MMGTGFLIANKKATKLIINYNLVAYTKSKIIFFDLIFLFENEKIS
jgi:hypothetical protein